MISKMTRHYDAEGNKVGITITYHPTPTFNVEETREALMQGYPTIKDELAMAEFVEERD